MQILTQKDTKTRKNAATNENCIQSKKRSLNKELIILRKLLR